VTRALRCFAQNHCLPSQIHVSTAQLCLNGSDIYREGRDFLVKPLERIDQRNEVDNDGHDFFLKLLEVLYQWN
jgi:hypothetical protein